MQPQGAVVRPPTPPAPAPVLDVVVPVYNEAAGLEASVRRLRHFLDTAVPWPAVVTVADNGSTDGTAALARRLADDLPGVRAIVLAEKGRGRALRAAWARSEAAVVAYTDVDLSTSLEALLPLVAPLVSGHSDVAIGTRLAAGARVWRGPKRELISRGYNLVLRASLHSRFTDAQCGFKALRAPVARRLLPLVEDEGWFFDTELLVLAQRSGLRIHEVPVDWVDDPDSRVDLVRTARDDLRGVVRLLRHPVSLRPTADRAQGGELADALSMFARIGAVSTAVYLALFLGLRGPIGGLAANAVALALCTAGNGVANRRLTFTAGPPLAPARVVAGAVAALATSLAFTVPVVVAADAAGLAWPWLAAALVAANAAAAVLRFVLLRAWLFRARPRAVRPAEEAR